MKLLNLGNCVRVTLLCVCIAISSLSQANEAAEEKDVTWQFDVGVALSYRAGIVDSLEDEQGQLTGNLLLAGGAYYKDFFFESSPLSHRPLTLGYTLDSSNDYRINLVVDSWFSDINPKDAIDNSLDGINTRHSSIEVGLEYERAYTHYDVRVRVLRDAFSTHGGAIASFEISSPLFFKNTLIIPSLSVAYLSEDATDYYYGIDPDEATPERPVYQPNGGLVSSVRFYLERPFNKHWSLIGFAGYARLSKAIADSPIVNPRSDSYHFGLGVLWTF